MSERTIKIFYRVNYWELDKGFTLRTALFETKEGMELFVEGLESSKTLDGKANKFLWKVEIES